MSYPLPKPLVLASLLASIFSSVATAAPIIQAVPSISGAAQTSSHSALGMSRSGRYILLPDNTSVRDMTIRDIKTQTTTALPLKVAFQSEHYAISPNGRYVSYTGVDATAPLGQRRMMQDLVTLAKTDILSNDESRALSDNGWAAFRDQTNGKGAQLFNSKTLTAQIFPEASSGLRERDVRNALSADGLITHYYSGGLTRIYDAKLKQSFVFNPIGIGGVPFTVRDWGSVVALASSGKYLAFKSDDVNDPNNGNLYRANLITGGTHTWDRFNLGAKFVTVEDGLSISTTGRFISFRGKLLAGHPEFAAVQAAGLTNPYRIFRYDTALNQLETVSVALDGGPLRNRFSQFPGSAWVNSTSIISDDGSMVSFATDADNIVSTMTDSKGLQNYHAYLGNGFARNYQFVEMPNTDNGWKPFAPMMLVGNNQWEGKLTFDGIGSEEFKFDVGGRLVNGKFAATPNWAINFGTSNVAGVAAANGGNILVPGAGTYDITFNDQTLAYTINNSSEFRLRHVGGRCVHGLGDTAFSNNGTPVTFGASCLNQPQHRFKLLANKSLQQVSSGMCLHPEGGSTTPAVGTRVVLWSQCDDGVGGKKLAFEFTSGGSIRHINSGLCVHPRGGSATPAVDTELVLWNSCNEPRLAIEKM